MALEREKFLVYLQDEGGKVDVHPVTIAHQDMTRGEIAHHLVGGQAGQGLNIATSWCWAALTRLGLYTGPYEQFRDMDCMGLEDDGKETVDPTQPGTPVTSRSS